MDWIAMFADDRNRDTVPTPIVPEHPSVEFMTELADCATYGEYESIDTMMFDFMDGELSADIDDAVSALFRTHWSAGIGDDAIDEFMTATSDMTAVPLLITHYGSGDVAYMNIMRYDVPVNADPAIVDAFEHMHVTYVDAGSGDEFGFMAQLFGIRSTRGVDGA